MGLFQGAGPRSRVWYPGEKAGRGAERGLGWGGERPGAAPACSPAGAARCRVTAVTGGWLPAPLLPQGDLLAGQ